jgi:hypothetical protein
MVAVRLGAGNTPLRWSKTPLPALENLGELRHADAFDAADRDRILLDDSAPTALERADGNWGPAVRRLVGHNAPNRVTVATLAAAFDEHLAPACRQPRTRADYWRAWRLVITWAVTRKAVQDILPMSLDTLKALIDVGHGLFRCSQLADRVGVEVGPGASPAVPAAAAALRGQHVLVLGQDARLCSRPATGVKAADSDDLSAVAAGMETCITGGASCAPADCRGNDGMLAGERGRSLASL